MPQFSRKKVCFEESLEFSCVKAALCMNDDRTANTHLLWSVPAYRGFTCLDMTIYRIIWYLPEQGIHLHHTDT